MSGEKMNQSENIKIPDMPPLQSDFNNTQSFLQHDSTGNQRATSIDVRI